MSKRDNPRLKEREAEKKKKPKPSKFNKRPASYQNREERSVSRRPAEGFGRHEKPEVNPNLS
jgi:hypothetical protein